MKHHVREIVAVACVGLLALSFAGCGDDDGGAGDPEGTSNALCDNIYDCYGQHADESEEEFVSACVEDFLEMYSEVEEQESEECRDAVLETDYCLSQLDCSDLDDGMAGSACEEEQEAEDQACDSNW